jgi:hypothetical protein
MLADVSGQSIGPIVRDQEIQKGFTTTCCLTTQKSADLMSLKSSLIALNSALKIFHFSFVKTVNVSPSTLEGV